MEPRSKYAHIIISTLTKLLYSVLIEQSNDVSEPPNTATGQYVYFEILEFQPIMLSLSFMRTERVNSDEQ